MLKVIDGHRLARWVSKTACNIAFVSRKHVPSPFARYAFSEDDDKAIYFYFMPQVGDTLEVNRDPSEFHWLRDQNVPDRAAMVAYVFGVPFLLSTFDVRGAERQVCELLDVKSTDLDGEFMDRLSAINIGKGDAKRGTIKFQWS